MKNALVTGSTEGIGKAIIMKLAAEGFNIAFNARSADKVKAMSDELKMKYPSAQVLGIPTDVSNKEALHAFATEVEAEWDQLNILVNNAGIFKPGDLLKEEEGQMENIMETNLYSAYHLTRMMYPLIKEARPGHIFNICSVASLKAYEGGGSYGISKYALLGFTKNLRQEVKEDGVKVTAILPGATLTASWGDIDFPEDRLMPPDDIAAIVWAAYNLSPQTVVEEIVIRPVLGDV